MLRLFETARRFDMEIQPQLILLQKTLFNMRALGVNCIRNWIFGRQRTLYCASG